MKWGVKMAEEAKFRHEIKHYINFSDYLAIKSRLEALGESLLYGFSEAENRKLYTNAGLRIIDEYQNYLSDRDLRFEQTEYEEEYNILHCYVELEFKNIVERIINEPIV